MVRVADRTGQVADRTARAVVAPVATLAMEVTAAGEATAVPVAAQAEAPAAGSRDGIAIRVIIIIASASITRAVVPMAAMDPVVDHTVPVVDHTDRLVAR